MPRAILLLSPVLWILACGGAGLDSMTSPERPADPDESAKDTGTLEEEVTEDTGELDLPDDPEDPVDTGEPQVLDDPSTWGPWAVGVKTVELWDESRWRTLPVEVWYPVDPTSPSGGENTYALEIFGLTVYEMQTPALRDAVPAAGDWPGVVFSHGYGGIRFQSYFLTEHLASHGFVVVAPDHMGNTLSEVYYLGSDEAAAQSAVDRPLDVRFVLDALLGGEIGLDVDPDRVGITGHSFGGWTSISTPLVDNRFVASFPMAPGFREEATPEMTAGLGIPLLIMGGTEDSTCDYEEEQRPAYEAAQRPKFLLGIEGAGHLDFSNLCEIELARLFVDDGCNEDLIDPAEVQDLSKTVSTAFAKVHVAGEGGYEVYLEASEVLALGDVEWQRETTP